MTKNYIWEKKNNDIIKENQTKLLKKIKHVFYTLFDYMYLVVPRVSVLSCGYHDSNTVDLILTPYWYVKHFKVYIWNSSKIIETFDQL